MLKFLLEKEFKYILRDKFISKMIFGMPLMMMLIFPWAANQEIKNLKLCVVDSDKSSYSERMINKVSSSGYFILSDIMASNREALESIERDRSDIVLEIEQDFEKNLISTGSGDVIVSANSVNGMKGGLGISYLSNIIRDFATEIGNANVNVSQAEIKVVPQYKFNPHLDYKFFMVPAITVILLTILSGFLPALNIVGEKEVGTIEQINVTPIKKSTFILSKLIPFWIIGLIALTLCFILAALVYGLVPVSGYLRIYLAACLYIVMASGMGLVVSNYSQTLQQAMFVSFFFIMILILMSGLFTPISSMPTWARNLAYFNPLRYFIEVMRMIYLKGSTLSDLLPHLGALTAFATVFNLWAVRSYRKNN